MTRVATTAKKSRSQPTRIQEKNEARILSAAEEVFALHGYRGATVDRIADKAGISKPNLLYYFNSKKALYQCVLETTVERWLVPLSSFDPEGEPADVLAQYIRIKIEYSRTLPFASKVWANELISGAPYIGSYLKKRLRPLIDDKAAAMRQWIADGKMDDVDPYHLFFMIWAATQTYADFGVQAAAVKGKSRLSKADFEEGADTVTRIILKGVGVSK